MVTYYVLNTWTRGMRYLFYAIFVGLVVVCQRCIYLYLFFYFAIWVQVYANITALLWVSWHIATMQLYKFCTILYWLSSYITKAFILCELHTFTLLYNNCYLVPHETRYITYISNIVWKKCTTTYSITYSRILQTLR